jgi:hypothetical protein
MIHKLAVINATIQLLDALKDYEVEVLEAPKEYRLELRPIEEYPAEPLLFKEVPPWKERRVSPWKTKKRGRK